MKAKNRKKRIVPKELDKPTPVPPQEAPPVAEVPEAQPDAPVEPKKHWWEFNG
jgi:hypothetical protein